MSSELPNRCLSLRMLAQKCPKIKLSYTLFAQKHSFLLKKTQGPPPSFFSQKNMFLKSVCSLGIINKSVSSPFAQRNRCHLWICATAIFFPRSSTLYEIYKQTRQTRYFWIYFFIQSATTKTILLKNMLNS